jgi:hypothetical protein
VSKGTKACVRSLRKVVTWYAAERIELITWVTRLQEKRDAAEARIADLLEHYEDRCAYESDALAKQEAANERIATLEGELAQARQVTAAWKGACSGLSNDLQRACDRIAELKVALAASRGGEESARKGCLRTVTELQQRIADLEGLLYEWYEANKVGDDPRPGTLVHRTRAALASAAAAEAAPAPTDAAHPTQRRCSTCMHWSHGCVLEALDPPVGLCAELSALRPDGFLINMQTYTPGDWPGCGMWKEARDA